MKRSNRLIILIGVFLAMIAFVGVVVLGSRGGGGGGSAPSVTTEPPVSVVVAKSDIKIGEKITNSNVGTVTMTRAQRDDLGSGTFSDIGQVLGLTAASNIAEGAYLYKDKNFAATGAVIAGQDLAPAIDPGMRAIALDVDQINGVGTLIVPGDHVDVILSVYVPQIGFDALTSGKTNVKVNGAAADVTTKLVIQNRKVLAVLTAKPPDQPVTPANPNPSATPTPTDNSVWLNSQHQIVILEVKPEETEVIRWAQRAENKMDSWNYMTLGLALRSNQDDNAADVKTQGMTFRQLTVIYNVLPPDPRGVIPADLLGKITW